MDKKSKFSSRTFKLTSKVVKNNQKILVQFGANYNHLTSFAIDFKLLLNNISKHLNNVI